MQRAHPTLNAGDRPTPAFDRACVEDVMLPGVFTCSTATSLAAVARLMSANHVHSVLVTETEVDAPGQIGRRAWGIVSELAMMRAAGALDEMVAREVMQVDLPTVHPATPLSHAARVMADRGVTHLIVDDPDTRQPLGVISSLDIIYNLAATHGRPYV